MISDISIPHNSTWQMHAETSKNMKYNTDTIYYSMKYHSHLEIHMYINI